MVSNDYGVARIDFVAKEAAFAAGKRRSVRRHFPVNENILPLEDGQPIDLSVAASFKSQPCLPVPGGKLIGALRHDGKSWRAGHLHHQAVASLADIDREVRRKCFVAPDKVLLQGFLDFHMLDGKDLLADCGQFSRQQPLSNLAGDPIRVERAEITEDDNADLLLRESDVSASVAFPTTRMPDPVESPETIHLQSKRVIQSGSIIQPSSNQHFRSPRRSADLEFVEISIPFGEVPNRRVDLSIAGDDPVGHIDAKSSLAILGISDRAILDNRGMIVMHLSGAHAQRDKNVFSQKLPQGLAGNSFHRQSQQEITGIAVGMLVSGIEVEVLLTTEHFQRLLIVDDGLILSAVKRKERVVVPKTAGVMDEMPESDSSTVGRKFRDPLADFVIQRKFPALIEEDNCRRRELLGNRADVKSCLRRDRHIVVQIGHAESPGVNGLASLENSNRTTRSARLIPWRKNFIDLRFDFRRQSNGPQ